MNDFEQSGDDDFSFAIPGLSRFRVSAYKQRGALSVVIRIISFSLPNPTEIGIPQRIIDFSNFSKGLVLVTGTAGSGKSTTLACIIDAINHHYRKHIITLEDPLEFLYRHDLSIISQREINVDTDRRELLEGVYRATIASIQSISRSEERRVGKECRSRWSPYH